MCLAPSKSSHLESGIPPYMVLAMSGEQRSFVPLMTRAGILISGRRAVTSKSFRVPVGVNSLGPQAVT